MYINLLIGLLFVSLLTFIYSQGRDFVTGTEIREWQGTGELGKPFLIIGAYFLIFRTAAYLALRYLKHNTTGRA